MTGVEQLEALFRIEDAALLALARIRLAPAPEVGHAGEAVGEELRLEGQRFLDAEDVGLEARGGLEDKLVAEGPAVPGVVRGAVADVEAHDPDGRRAARAEREGEEQEADSLAHGDHPKSFLGWTRAPCRREDANARSLGPESPEECTHMQTSQTTPFASLAAVLALQVTQVTRRFVHRLLLAAT